MSNVLGTLFGDIAEAIRSKTGEAGTMKPAEFPDKIAGISVGGTGGDGEWVIASGTVDANGATQTVTHGLGVIPDIVTVTLNSSGVGGIPSETESAGRVVAGCVFSEKMLGEAGLTEKKYGYTFIYNPVNGSTLIGTPTDGLEKIDGYTYSGICNVNARTLQIGSNYVKLFTTKSYSWAAYVRK